MNRIDRSRSSEVVIVDPDAFTPYYDRNLAHVMSRRGWAVSIITSRCQFEQLPSPEEAAVSELFFRRVKHGPWPPAVRRVLKTIAYPSGLLALDRWLRRRTPGIVHCQWALFPPLDGMMWRCWQKLGWRIIVTMHDTVALKGTTPTLWASFARKLPRLADTVLVHTSYDRARMEKAGIPAHSIQVVPQGGPGLFQGPAIDRLDARMQFGIDADRPVILFFGLLKPYKGLDVLLRAMVPISKAEPSVMLWIVGETACSTHRYRHLMRRLGVSEKVIWERGYLPWRMVTPAFAAADVIVLPYRQASASAVLVTAFANERPVVASAIGPLAEMIEHGATGLLFPVGDPEALANSVISLLSNSRVRARMGRRAGEIAEQRHGWDHIADRTVAVYRAALRSEA